MLQIMKPLLAFPLITSDPWGSLFLTALPGYNSWRKGGLAIFKNGSKNHAQNQKELAGGALEVPGLWFKKIPIFSDKNIGAGPLIFIGEGKGEGNERNISFGIDSCFSDCGGLHRGSGWYYSCG
jgi:hypothetical protein